MSELNLNDRRNHTNLHRRIQATYFYTAYKEACISAVRHSGTLVTISGVLTAARVRTVLLTI